MLADHLHAHQLPGRLRRVGRKLHGRNDGQGRAKVLIILFWGFLRTIICAQSVEAQLR